jgi:hypothetical protein
MTDLGLRLLLLIIFSLTMLVSGKVILWTVSPWIGAVTGTGVASRVSVEPITLIEGGKIQATQGAPIAAQLSHRLNQIMAGLSRNLTKEYELVRKHLKVSFPEATATSNVNFDAFIADPIKFEAKVFNIDIIGIGNFFYSQLNERDEVSIFLEIAAAKSRYFAEINRQSEGASRMGGDIAGDVHAAIDQIACDVAYQFLSGNDSLAGMAREEFCPFEKALGEFQAFIADTAAAAERKEPISATRLNGLVDQFENPPLSDSKAAVVHMIAAGLYKLKGDLDSAIKKLEHAAEIAAGHVFVQQNLEAWLKEQENQKSVVTISSSDLAELTEAYNVVRSQEALKRIAWIEMMDASRALPPKQDVIVAVFSTGYTSGTEPQGSAGELLPVEVMIPGAKADDLNGHGNSVANLLAALTPDSAIKILPIKVLDETGSGSNEFITLGVGRAVERGAKVLLLPLGSRAEMPGFRTAIDAARVKGLIVIAAAGNEPEAVSFPGNLPEALAVGTVTLDGRKASFSPDEQGVEIFLPGVDIDLVVNGKLEKQSGSSFAATIAAAAIATALSRTGPLTQSGILEAVTASAKKLHNDGPPVLQADKFLEAAMNLR